MIQSLFFRTRLAESQATRSTSPVSAASSTHTHTRTSRRPLALRLASSTRRRHDHAAHAQQPRAHPSGEPITLRRIHTHTLTIQGRADWPIGIISSLRGGGGG